MQVKGIQTVRSQVDVEVDEVAMLSQLFDAWKLKTLAQDKRFHNEHLSINAAGVWEGWVDGHGSGITNTYRKATSDEVRIYVAFQTIVFEVDQLKRK